MSRVASELIRWLKQGSSTIPAASTQGARPASSKPIPVAEPQQPAEPRAERASKVCSKQVHSSYTRPSWLTPETHGATLLCRGRATTGWSSASSSMSMARRAGKSAVSEQAAAAGGPKPPDMLGASGGRAGPCIASFLPIVYHKKSLAANLQRTALAVQAAEAHPSSAISFLPPAVSCPQALPPVGGELRIVCWTSACVA
jgi:hypothetical protein